MGWAGLAGWLQSLGNPLGFYIPCFSLSVIPTLPCVWEMVLEFSSGRAVSRGFLALFTALPSLGVPRSGESSELPFCLIQL